jgi:uncharacterized membrane protein (UPF0127 family)
VLTNISRDSVLLTSPHVADNLWTRFVGLMGKSNLPTGEGLILEPASSIHMFFMRFPIDAVFVDRDWKVLFIAHSIKPWRVSRIVRHGRRVIEMPAGTCVRTHTQVGDTLGLVGPS